MHSASAPIQEFQHITFSSVPMGTYAFVAKRFTYSEWPLRPHSTLLFVSLGFTTQGSQIVIIQILKPGLTARRGPDVETWIGVEDGTDPALENEWPLLPFMALADGAHSYDSRPHHERMKIVGKDAETDYDSVTEDFSYFTLRREATPDGAASSLFGISCTRQMDANDLKNRPAYVTRSTVQKAVVAVCDSPQYFGHLKEKLSAVTKAWFAQWYDRLGKTC